MTEEVTSITNQPLPIQKELKSGMENGSGIGMVATKKIESLKPKDEISRQLDEYERLIEKAHKIEDIPFGLLRKIANRIMSLADFSPELINGRKPSDMRLIKAGELFDLAMQRDYAIRGYPPPEPFDRFIPYSSERAQVLEVLQPGCFVVHAGYSSELPKIIRSKGLSAPNAKLGNETTGRDQITRFQKYGSGYPDESAIFFYPWNTRPSNGKRTRGAGWYTSGTNYGDNRGLTDMCFFIPLKV